jgi:hypothetical protein
VERGRVQMTIWRVRIPCRIIKATDTHSEQVMATALSTTTILTRTPINVTLCVHCLSCFFFSVFTSQAIYINYSTFWMTKCLQLCLGNERTFHSFPSVQKFPGVKTDFVHTEGGAFVSGINRPEWKAGRPLTFNTVFGNK